MAAIFATNNYVGFDNHPMPGTSMSTTASLRDDKYSDACITMGSGNPYLYKDFTPHTDLWFHMTFRSNVTGGHVFANVEFYNTTESQIVFRLMRISGAGYLQYWDGGTYQTISSPETHIGLVDDILYDIDIHIKMDNSVGVISLYKDSILMAEYTGDTIFSAALNIDRIYIKSSYSGVGSSAPCYYSQIIVYPTSTIGMKLLDLTVNSIGGETDFDGVYTDVNQVAYNADTYVKSATADQISTFGVVNMISQPDPTNLFNVKEVFVQSRVKRGSTGPQNFQHVVRSNGVNYFSSSHSLEVGLTRFNTDSWVVDPNTSSDWTDAAITNLEVGFKSIT